MMPPQPQTQPYDETGAMGGLFAPAFIRGNPQSEAAVTKWQAENFAVTPEMIEATRGPSTTVPTSGSMGGARAMPGSGSMTIPGSVDPEALKIYAQGGKYTPKPKPQTPAGGSGDMRDQIAATLAGRQEVHPLYGPIMRQRPPSGGIPPGMHMANSPLQFLLGEGDSQGFMQGSFPGGV